MERFGGRGASVAAQFAGGTYEVGEHGTVGEVIDGRQDLIHAAEVVD
ncbi:hypothetical protein AB0N79_36450 [Streptomyces microflavus]